MVAVPWEWWQCPGIGGSVLGCLQAADASSSKPSGMFVSMLWGGQPRLMEKPPSNTGHGNWVTVSFALLEICWKAPLGSRAGDGSKRGQEDGAPQAGDTTRGPGWAQL